MSSSLSSIYIWGLLTCFHLNKESSILTIKYILRFFLVFKLCSLGFFITTYFGHGKCFIWEFLVFAFIETARRNITSCSNFSWSWNDTIFVCKLYMSSLKIKTLILEMSKFWDNLYVDRFLLVAFVKCILSRITVFGTVLLDTF